MRDPKQADAALDDMVAAAKAPKGTLSNKESAAVSCGEAIAALKANKIQDAEDAWDAAVKTAGDNACQFRPPYDKLGTKFFIAYTQYRDASSPQKREGAVKLFTQLVDRAQGGTADWLRALLRSGYELLAYDFYQRSRREARRRSSWRRRRRCRPRATGASSSTTWRSSICSRAARCKRRRCSIRSARGRARRASTSASCSDRQGESKKALDLYKQAKACGARTPKLNEWIDVKERLFGGAP